MEKEKRPQFKIIYINEIGFGNRINKKAYLSCMEDESFYYVFPSCSDSFNSDIRYENQKVFIKGNKSHGNHLFDLRRLIQLPKDRTSICSSHIILGEEYINEIIKKVKDCSRYIDYPNKVIDFFKRQSSSISIDDLVIFNENTYVIRGYKGKSLVGSRAFPYPANGTCYEVVDCQQFYVYTGIVEEIEQSAVEYVSHLNNFCNRFKTKLFVDKTKDYSKLYNLDPGMIIYGDAGNTVLILDNKIDEIEVVLGSLDAFIGKDGSKKLSPIIVPCSFKFNYKVIGKLTDDRLEDVKRGCKISCDKVYKKE